MGLKIIFPEKIYDMDEIVMKLAGHLIKRFEGLILCVEHFKGWDGSNVRIVVTDVGRADEIIDSIFEFEKIHGIVGTIIPEIISKDEYEITIRNEKPLILPQHLLDELWRFLRRKFDTIIAHIEGIEGWDGSNVRIIVTDVGRAGEIIDSIFEFEKMHGIVGTIIPEIVSEDEYGICR